jgi:hypothetical protein
LRTSCHGQNAAVAAVRVFAHTGFEEAAGGGFWHKKI